MDSNQPALCRQLQSTQRLFRLNLVEGHNSLIFHEDEPPLQSRAYFLDDNSPINQVDTSVLGVLEALNVAELCCLRSHKEWSWQCSHPQRHF